VRGLDQRIVVEVVKLDLGVRAISFLRNCTVVCLIEPVDNIRAGAGPDPVGLLEPPSRGQDF
jgi:hypothetical protein